MGNGMRIQIFLFVFNLFLTLHIQFAQFITRVLRQFSHIFQNGLTPLLHHFIIALRN